MDVRFLVDDLNLAPQSAAPKADANDVSKAHARSSQSAEARGQKTVFDKS